MLSETISGWFDEYEEKGMQQGFKKGIEKGIEKGKTEKEQEMLNEQREMFKVLINKNFDQHTADFSWELLQKIKTSELFTQVAEYLFQCKTGEQLLERIRSLTMK